MFEISVKKDVVNPEITIRFDKQKQKFVGTAKDMLRPDNNVTEFDISQETINSLLTDINNSEYVLSAINKEKD